MSTRKVFCAIFSISMFLGLFSPARTQSAPTNAAMPSQQAKEEDELKEWNNQIRREKFDIVLPVAMRKNYVDMWIHVMRDAITDPFGEEEFGSASGVFVFTDRGGDRIERAVLGRRWGATQRQEGEGETHFLEECGAYDIIHDPVFVQEPLASPMTEYDYRFKGLGEFVKARDPQRIAVNFLDALGPWETSTRVHDGISLKDYRLLVEELGESYADRLISSEYMLMEYIIRTVPSEIELLKKMRQDELERVKKAFAEIVPDVTVAPGITKVRELGVTLFRRSSTGISQRGWNPGYEDMVAQRGDIVSWPSQGMYGYVLREGETEPPQEVRKLWAEYLKIDKILAENIKAGLTAREIMETCKRKFSEVGIIVREDQMHMVQPKNNFPVYSMGFDPEKTHLSIDCHGMGKGAREFKFENYFGPRVSSYGPEWTWDIPLRPNHHFVLEYFFYMPSPTSNNEEDQYLFFWDHEEAIATENGVEYLSPPQKELYLIK